MAPGKQTTLEKLAVTVGGSVVVALLIWIASSVAGLKESAAAFVEWKVSIERRVLTLENGGK